MRCRCYLSAGLAATSRAGSANADYLGADGVDGRPPTNVLSRTHSPDRSTLTAAATVSRIVITTGARLRGILSKLRTPNLGGMSVGSS